MSDENSYSLYSDKQLMYAMQNMDKTKFSEKFRELQKELEKRGVSLGINTEMPNLKKKVKSKKKYIALFAVIVVGYGLYTLGLSWIANEYKKKSVQIEAEIIAKMDADEPRLRPFVNTLIGELGREIFVRYGKNYKPGTENKVFDKYLKFDISVSAEELNDHIKLKSLAQRIFLSSKSFVNEENFVKLIVTLTAPKEQTGIVTSTEGAATFEWSGNDFK